MTNIVKTNNQQLRLAPLSVGLLSTLRIALPMVPQSATNVEVIVTSGDTHNAYTATFDSTNRWWLCDIDASQFPTVGRQKYEVAYKISGDQFWDGQGWIEIVKATTSGITPTPAPDPSRYVVVTINGYGAQNPDGAVRIPRLFISQTDPSTTTGYIEGDQYFNRTSGEQWVLCSVTGALAWVKCAGGGVVSVNGKAGVVVLAANDVGAYTKGETDATVARIDEDIATARGAGTQALLDAAAAMAVANDAQSMASSAASEASSAFTEAANAYSNAKLALSAANGAESVANAARSEASEANGIANRAEGKADQAQSTADTASDEAAEALTTAVLAAGYKTEYDGVNVSDDSSVRLLGVQRYYNIQSACRFSLPTTSGIPEGGGRWLFHLADNIQASQVIFIDQQNRTIVTNNSTTAYAGSITGDKMGLSHAWKMVTIRIFKNPQGAEIVYLEV